MQIATDMLLMHFHNNGQAMKWQWHYKIYLSNTKAIIIDHFDAHIKKKVVTNT